MTETRTPEELFKAASELYKKGDVASAREHFEQAAALGDVQSIFNVALFCLNGIGGPEDEKRAREFFELAVSKGFHRAKHQAASLMAQGIGGPVDEISARALMEEVISSDEEVTPEDKHLLGLLLACNHEGPEKPEEAEDNRRARELFEQVLNEDEEHIRAKFFLTSMVYSGHGGPQDLKLARQLMEEIVAAKNSGEHDALHKYHLSSFLRRGVGGPKDEKLGRKLLEEAGSAGHVEALFDLAGVYWKGIGGPIDIEKAGEIYEQLGAAGHLDSLVNLSEMVAEADPARGRDLMQKAADAGSVKAKLRYGQMLVRGGGGRHDNRKGFGLIKEAAEAGLARAKFFLGVLLLISYNDGDTAEDIKGHIEEGKVWLKRALEPSEDFGTIYGLMKHPGETPAHKILSLDEFRETGKLAYLENTPEDVSPLNAQEIENLVDNYVNKVVSENERTSSKKSERQDPMDGAEQQKRQRRPKVSVKDPNAGAEENRQFVKMGGRVPGDLREEFLKMVEQGGYMNQSVALTEALQNWVDERKAEQKGSDHPKPAQGLRH